MAGDTAIARAERLVALARALGTTTPPPRGLPYLGLDHPSGTRLATLARLAAQGIFRKYEQVLDLGTPLGATSRWMAACLGCDAIGTPPDEDRARAAALLTRRSPIRGRVQLVAARSAALPFASGRFTHVWAIESLSGWSDPLAALVEAHRVVRPGGWLGVQELVHRDPDLPGWRGDPDALRALVAGAGFVATRLDDVSADAVEEEPRVLAAHERLAATTADDAAAAAMRRAIAAGLRGGGITLVQVTARRRA